MQAKIAPIGSAVLVVQRIRIHSRGMHFASTRSVSPYLLRHVFVNVALGKRFGFSIYEQSLFLNGSDSTDFDFLEIAYTIESNNLKPITVMGF